MFNRTSSFPVDVIFLLVDLGRTELKKEIPLLAIRLLFLLFLWPGLCQGIGLISSLIGISDFFFFLFDIFLRNRLRSLLYVFIWHSMVGAFSSAVHCRTELSKLSIDIYASIICQHGIAFLVSWKLEPLHWDLKLPLWMILTNI